MVVDVLRVADMDGIREERVWNHLWQWAHVKVVKVECLTQGLCLGIEGFSTLVAGDIPPLWLHEKHSTSISRHWLRQLVVCPCSTQHQSASAGKSKSLVCSLSSHHLLVSLTLIIIIKRDNNYLLICSAMYFCCNEHWLTPSI
jgi:hypothetical protein